ncbi:tryptophan-rich antigen (Pv-fam-a) [Plasmodium vivax Brazil I]|uniref:Tryptophan-rich antigen (Pv-fam-a) n=1 Tax=Plasmodium vivax (strain Brazil I) TaxID=1033975 RepID=A0A0J9SPH5_PLAV1|nr:tryptophan-rich antigen (Pv-fam-a) [Plasmodium vivax Brazil I]
MELNEDPTFMSPIRALLKNATNINKESILSQIDARSFVPYIYVIIFTLGAVLLFVKRFPQKKNDNIPQLPQKKESHKEIALEQGLIEKSEELKKYAWNNWFMKLQSDWKYFNSALENEKQTWFDEKEKEWQEWLKSMENRWTHYNENMDAKFKSYILKNSQGWDDNQWETWIKNDGKKFMETNYHKWIDENYSNYNAWVVKRWEQWKNEKILTWLLKDWRRNEFEYWYKFKNMTLPEPLYERAKNNWNKWNKRLSKEKEQWKKWVAAKYELYENSECKQWKKWKDDREVLFNNWIESFINTWVADKKWNVWIEEKKNAATS